MSEVLNDKDWENAFSFGSDMIKIHGKTNQIVKAAEELGELQHELLKAVTSTPDKLHIAEEFGDVLVILAQVKIMFDLSSAELADWVDYKIWRERKKM